MCRHAQGKKERQNGNGCNSSKVVHNKSLKAAHCVRWTASVGAWLRHCMRRLALPLSSTLYGENMKGTNIGNQLNNIVVMARYSMFEQGELAELTYGALDIAARGVRNSEVNEIEVTFPVGYKADRTIIPSTKNYQKDELISKYEFLAFQQLSQNSLVQLVTTVETMLGDIVRALVIRYPQKLGGKRAVPMQAILESSSIEEVHHRATDILLNELAYKSPAEFADSMRQLLSINLLECPAYHRYMEIKATRDIYIHNRGVANEIYIRKSGSHARVISGVQLPADIQYFLESYECCLQLSDWLETELNSHWQSLDYEERKQEQSEAFHQGVHLSNEVLHE